MILLMIRIRDKDRKHWLDMVSIRSHSALSTGTVRTNTTGPFLRSRQRCVWSSPGFLPAPCHPGSFLKLRTNGTAGCPPASSGWSWSHFAVSSNQTEKHRNNRLRLADCSDTADACCSNIFWACEDVHGVGQYGNINSEGHLKGRPDRSSAWRDRSGLARFPLVADIKTLRIILTLDWTKQPI